MQTTLARRRLYTDDLIRSLLVSFGLLFPLLSAFGQTPTYPKFAFSTQYSDSVCLKGILEQEKQAISSFYSTRSGSLLWTERSRKIALEQLEAAQAHGLEPSRYCLPGLVTLSDQSSPSSRDRDFSLAMARYVLDMQMGRIKASKNSEATIDALSQLAANIDKLPEFTNALIPPYPAYRKLLLQLEALKKRQQTGDWPQIYKQTAESPEAVAAYFRQTGDLKTTLPEATLEEVEAATKLFQERHGLEVDGIIGRKTLAVMATPIEERIGQVVATLERIRSEISDLKTEHILVNIPAFMAYALVQGEPVFTSRAVVGTRKNQTPTFGDLIEYIVINPSWYVPKSIVKNEFLPELQNDLEEFMARDITIRDNEGSTIDPLAIDWQRTPEEVILGLRFVQLPGPQNALGRLKIIFPNQRSIYMHDTPETYLFNRAGRTFSHGCVRLEKPYAMASLIVKLAQSLNTQEPASPSEITVAEIRKIVASKKRRVLKITPNLPVNIVYHTADAWTNPKGPIRFLVDVYDRDKELLLQLERINARYR